MRLGHTRVTKQVVNSQTPVSLPI